MASVSGGIEPVPDDLEGRRRLTKQERDGQLNLPLAGHLLTDHQRRMDSFSADIRIEDGVLQQDLDALDRRYSRASADPATGVYNRSVTLVLRPERWIAWADYDD